MSTINKTYEDCPDSVFPSNYDFTDDERMEDLTTDDWAKVKDYENALNSGDETSANKHLQSIKNADRKIFSASKWNKLRDSIRACQKYFIEEIEGLIKSLNDKITTGYATLSDKINANYTTLDNKIKTLFKNKGTYNTNTTYNAGDIVTYMVDNETFSYLCTVNDTVNIVPTIKSNWTCVSIKGDAGQFNPRGLYSNTETYNKYDCVVYNGVNYIAIATSKGVAPDTDTNKWKVFLEGSVSDADTVDGKHASEFFRYTDLGSKETNINSVLATGIYKCTNFRNYPSPCIDNQGTLQVINYANSNSENINATMGVDNLWLKQYYTEPHYGKTYERYINGSTINPWVLVGGEFNTKTLKNPTSTTHSDWSGNDVTGNIIPTMNMFAYWNGAYNSNNASNLLYCSKGAFGDIVTKSASEYATSNHNHYGGIIDPGGIELGRNMNGNGGYIDFHYNNSSTDYTSRIIESSYGELEIPGLLKIRSMYPVLANGWVLSTFSSSSSTGSRYIKIDIGGWILKVMYGKVATNNGTTIAFPTTFNGIPMVFISPIINTSYNDTIKGCSIKSVTNTNFSIKENSATYKIGHDVAEEFTYINWFAIGM